MPADRMAVAGTMGKSLMDGEFAPLHNTNVFREAMDTNGQWCRMVQAGWSELDGAHGTEFTEGVDFSEPPGDTVSLKRQLRHLMIMILECGTGASMLAANIVTALSALNADERKQSRTRLDNHYYEFLRTTLTQYDMDFLFAVDESGISRLARFEDSLGKLIERNGENDVRWPAPDGNPQAGETEVIAAMAEIEGNPQYAFGERLSAVMVNVPPLGRLLTYKLSQVLYPKWAGMLGKYILDAYTVQNPFQGAKRSLNGYFLDAGLKDGKDSNAQRLVRRVSYLAVIRMSQFMAFQNCLANLRGIAAGVLAPNVDTRFGYEDFSNSVHVATSMVDRVMDDTVHPVTQFWVFSPMGQDRQAVPKGADASHALHFLNAQLKDKSSMYQMPEVTATQKSWDDWFQRVAALKSTYHGINDSVVIPMLLSHLGVDDKRIVGWNEACKEAFSRNEKKTLEQMIAHIKGLVVPTETLRRDAARQLLKLTGQPYKEPDCQTLGSKVLLIFRSLFPPITSEVEPMTKLTAVKNVHQMLYRIKMARPGDSSVVLVTAWVQFTGYQHFEMFQTYIEENLHTSKLISDRLCWEYINKVVEQLTVAHRMYIQMQSVMPRSQQAQTPVNTGHRSGRPQHQVGAIGNHGNNPRTTHQVGAMGSNGSNYRTGQGQSHGNGNASSSERQRSRSRPRSNGNGGNANESSGRGRGSRSGSRGPGRGRATGRGDAGRGRGRGSAGVQYTPEEHSRRVHAAMARAGEAVGDRYRPGNLRHEMDRNLDRGTLSWAADKVVAGSCLLCQNPGHFANNCPHFAKASSEVQQKAREMRTVYFDEYNKADG